ncbi:nucleotidyltransferase domain-containing protein [Candidatus Oleimmundimicrobium sp.]|uniref:nucleotidyltransferase domain-containing protein n=1 Tax=Candidatus Oleimmundimicrobium sp. TaxID=3060597 RepID=UPI002719E510|nr:nucleotidyltransferase domain-containing protein [Candidatus Oleimmundimicrobium sp.]MDO8886207.1 nucleotidyltransferase domain-containing protein [Candidatus Oleimmundimicrobium sp.]
MSVKEKLFFTNYHKILFFLISNPTYKYTEKEIKEATNVSRAGINFALKDLAEDNLVVVEKRGKMSFYTVDLKNPLIRQLKLIANLIILDPLLAKVKSVSQKVVLFGSAASGTNIEESDFDLFVLSNNPRKILDIVSDSQLAEKIQLIVKKPIDVPSLKKKDPIFYDEIERGLVLWERENE